MKHLVFFLSVVVAAVVISGGAYVYSSSADWRGGEGFQMPFGWVQSAEVPALEKNVEGRKEGRGIPPLDGSVSTYQALNPGDLYRDVKGNFFYPKILVPGSVVLETGTNEPNFANEDRAARLRHLEVPASGTRSNGPPPALGFPSSRYSSRDDFGFSPRRSGRSGGGTGSANGGGEEPLLTIVRSIPLPDELKKRPSITEEEDPEIKFEEPVGNEPPYVDGDYPQTEQTPAPVPEPATWLMLIAGLVMVALARKRRV